jgi:DEAD/DEAH box helicase domain-containing protein
MPALGPPPLTEPKEFAAGWRPAQAGAGGPASGGEEPGETGWPAVYLYDAVPAGVGFAEACFERFAALVGSAISLVDGCGCDGGCPSCVGPPPPGQDARAAALRLLRLALP